MVYVSNNAINDKCICHPFLEQEREYLLKKFGAFSAVTPSGIFKVSDDSVTKMHKTSKKDKLIAWFSAFNGDFFNEVLHLVRDKK